MHFKSGISFDAVLFDVDSKDISLGMSCPPSSFLETNVLTNIKSIIGSKGVFIINLVCRNDELRTQALKNLDKYFSAICTYKLEEDINEVIYCSNDKNYQSLDKWKKILSASAKALNNSVKKTKLNNTDMLNICDFMSDLSI